MYTVFSLGYADLVVVWGTHVEVSSRQYLWSSREVWAGDRLGGYRREGCRPQRVSLQERTVIEREEQEIGRLIWFGFLFAEILAV